MYKQDSKYKEKRFDSQNFLTKLNKMQFRINVMTHQQCVGETGAVRPAPEIFKKS